MAVVDFPFSRRSYTTPDIAGCVAGACHIASPDGETLARDLAVGDRLITRDRGIQRIVSIHYVPIPDPLLALRPDLAPVRIPAAGLGNDLPFRDLCVSPQTDMLLSYERLGHRAVPAIELTNRSGIGRYLDSGITYVAIGFDRPSHILAEGCWVATRIGELRAAPERSRTTGASAQVSRFPKENGQKH